MAEQHGMSVQQKLLIAGLFLVLVAVAVGDEDTPGLLTIAQKTAASDEGEVADGETKIDGPRRSAPQKSEPDPAISQWYAEVSPDGDETAPRPDDMLPDGSISGGSSVEAVDSVENFQANAAGQPDRIEDESEWETLR